MTNHVISDVNVLENELRGFASQLIRSATKKYTSSLWDIPEYCKIEKLFQSYLIL